MLRGLIITLLVLLIVFFAFLIGLGTGLVLIGENGFVSGDKVAIMTIDGIILDSQTYLESLSKIKKDDSIKALVLRINSPGGAVGPSQEIYSEAKALREKMPVIASLGSVAASGGYYIACGAQKIIANPGTITGSIGVIAQFVSYEQLLNWAKVDVEIIKSGKFKDAGSPFREMTEAEKEYMQKVIDNVHTQFKHAVSQSRNLSENEIDKISDGRIFTGQQALNLNLIDELGSISDAINLAGNLGGIKGPPNVIYYPKKKKSIIDFIFSKIDSHGLSSVPLKERFGLFYLVNITN